MQKIIMKTINIAISLAVLVSVIFINSYNVLAKERRLCLIEFCFLDETDDSSNIIMGWMMNPDYFHQSENENIDSSTNLEDWMLDIHHFISPVLAENENKSEVIESWMKRKEHFYSFLNIPIVSKYKKLDNHLGNFSLIVAKK
jgi:hypothetical protein